MSDQTIVVPLGGILPVDATTRIRVRFHALLRSSLSGSNWLFTQANGIIDLYRWLPWVSRQIAFDRPNHGDPFETPIEPLGAGHGSSRPRGPGLATTGDRTSVSANGLTQTFAADERARLHGHRRDRLPDAVARSSATRSSASTTGPGAPGAAMLDAAADAFDALERRLGPYPHPDVPGRPVGRRRTGWSRPGSSGSRPAAARTCATWPPTRPPTSGSTGSSATTRRGSRSPTRPRPTSRRATSWACSAAAAARRRPSIGRSTSTRRACYYEKIYIQGGNLLDEARRQMGSTAFWAALRGYIAANRNTISTTQTLLQALDAGTPLDLGKTLFAPRFPRDLLSVGREGTP